MIAMVMTVAPVTMADVMVVIMVAITAAAWAMQIMATMVDGFHLAEMEAVAPIEVDAVM
jgi:hypothetical protein